MHDPHVLERAGQIVHEPALKRHRPGREIDVRLDRRRGIDAREAAPVRIERSNPGGGEGRGGGAGRHLERAGGVEVDVVAGDVGESPAGVAGRGEPTREQVAAIALGIDRELGGSVAGQAC
ncbi:MAG: hypothetical protein ACO3ZY_13185, partial [Phycisphaerales bacterium]